MPIPVAGFAARADEDERAPEAFGAPFPGPPQVEAGEGEDEEGEVAGAVDGFAERAVTEDNPLRLLAETPLEQT